MVRIKFKSFSNYVLAAKNKKVTVPTPPPPPQMESSDEFVSADEGLSEEEEVEDSMATINARLMATIGELSGDDQATFKVHLAYDEAQFYHFFSAC